MKTLDPAHIISLEVFRADMEAVIGLPLSVSSYEKGSVLFTITSPTGFDVGHIDVYLSKREEWRFGGLSGLFPGDGWEKLCRLNTKHSKY